MLQGENQMLLQNEAPNIDIVDQPGTLVVDHLPRLEQNLSSPAPVVLNVERPVLVHILRHVQDHRDDVALLGEHFIVKKQGQTL